MRTGLTKGYRPCRERHPKTHAQCFLHQKHKGDHKAGDPNNPVAWPNIKKAPDPRTGKPRPASAQAYHRNRLRHDFYGDGGPPALPRRKS